MEWIKANEKTPAKEGLYFAKWKNDKESGKTLIEWDGQLFYPMYDYKLTEVEWLDEDK